MHLRFWRKRSEALVVEPEKNSDDARATGAATDKLQITGLQSIPLPVSNIEFYHAEYFAQESSWLSRFIPLKRAVVNYGFELVPTGGEDKQVALDEWLDRKCPPPVEFYVDPITQETIKVESTTTFREWIDKFVADVWHDFILMDQVLALWMDGRPFLMALDIVRCQYTDILGVEEIRYQHMLTPIQLQRLSKKDQDRFRKRPTIVLNPAEGEHFKVLKRARTGTGFSKPTICTIFPLLREVQSKEEGFSLMAFLMRLVTRHHLIGHDIKSGDHAGKPWYMFKEKDGKKLKALWEDSVGIREYVSNFDEKTEFPWPDVKLFDETAWRGSSRRLKEWAGPIGDMLTTLQVMPYLMTALRAQVTEEREKVGHYLTSVINAAFPTMPPVTVGFSDLIFNESRLQAELIKFGVTQGLCSNQTAQEVIGLNPTLEDSRKSAEADDPDTKKKRLPLWDPAHALTPALGQTAASLKVQTAAKGANPSSPANGHPAGTPNAS
jgi:hypothetical protein